MRECNNLLKYVLVCDGEAQRPEREAPLIASGETSDNNSSNSNRWMDTTFSGISFFAWYRFLDAQNLQSVRGFVQ